MEGHKVYMVVAYLWDDSEIDKVFFSEKSAQQRVSLLNSAHYLNLQWTYEEVEIGD